MMELLTSAVLLIAKIDLFIIKCLEVFILVAIFLLFVCLGKSLFGEELKLFDGIVNLGPSNRKFATFVVIIMLAACLPVHYYSRTLPTKHLIEVINSNGIPSSFLHPLMKWLIGWITFQWILSSQINFDIALDYAPWTFGFLFRFYRIAVVSVCALYLCTVPSIQSS